MAQVTTLQCHAHEMPDNCGVTPVPLLLLLFQSIPAVGVVGVSVGNRIE